MLLLLGTFFYQIDEKSRFYIPKKFRKDIGGLVVVVKSIEECLCVYPFEEFRELIKMLKEQSLKSGGDHCLQRSIGRGAEKIWLEKNGRIVLSSGSMDHASLERGEVLILGAIDHFEVWHPKIWEKSAKERKEDKWQSILASRN